MPRVLADFRFSHDNSPAMQTGQGKTNMAYRDEIDDAFDAVVFLEERYSFTLTMHLN